MDTRNATREELTQRCGHECLKPPDHDGPHFYGYIGGPYSYEGLLAEVDRLRGAIEQHREDTRDRLGNSIGNRGFDGRPIIVPTDEDRHLWAQLGDREPVLCRACHYGHFNECEDERCESMRLEDRHE